MYIVIPTFPVTSTVTSSPTSTHIDTSTSSTVSSITSPKSTITSTIISSSTVISTPLRSSSISLIPSSLTTSFQTETPTYLPSGKLNKQKGVLLCTQDNNKLFLLSIINYEQ